MRLSLIKSSFLLFVHNLFTHSITVGYRQPVIDYGEAIQYNRCVLEDCETGFSYRKWWGRFGCTLDELDAYLDDMIAGEWQMAESRENICCKDYS